MTVADIEAMVDQVYLLNKAKPQQIRHGETSKWFAPRMQDFAGRATHYKVITQVPTGTRMRTVTAADAGEYVSARDMTAYNVGVPYSALREFQGTVKVNLSAERITSDREHAVFNIADELVRQAALDCDERKNIAIHQGSAAVLASVVQKYDPDGTTYTGSTQTVAYLKIDGGSIARFKPGQILDIRAASASTVRVTCQVNDVVYPPDGPEYGASTVADIGPGIVVTYYSTEGTGTNAHFDNVVDGDEIVLSGESTTSGFHGFEDWFSQTTDVYVGEDLSTALDRDGVGNSWSHPIIITGGTDAAPVTFDPDTHLARLAVRLPYQVKYGKEMRTSEDDVSYPQVMAFITTPEIVNEAVQDAKDSIRFTSVATASMDEATRKNVWGEVGFNGFVWHSPFGDVAMQADPVCKENRGYIVNPESFFWLAQKGTSEMSWLPNAAGGRFHMVYGTNGGLTKFIQGGYSNRANLQCDQPSSNAMITGIKGTVWD